MIVASFANPFGLETECVRNINACLGGVWPSMLLDCGFGFAVLLDTPLSAFIAAALVRAHRNGEPGP